MTELGRRPTERLEIREEAPADHGAVRALNRAAFGGPDEAEIVERMRGGSPPAIARRFGRASSSTSV